MPKQDRFSRRSFLKTASALGVAGMVPSVARAESKSDFRRTIEQSLRVKEATNSIEKWHAFLRHRGIDVQSTTRRYQLPMEDEGEVGVQHWYPDELDISITISAPGCTGDEYYVDLTWSYINNTGDNHVGGEIPLDIAGLYWDPNWWDLTSKDTSQSFTSSNYVSYRDGSFDGDGPAFNVDDLSIYGHDETDTWYCGAYLVPLGDFTTSERRVYGEYCHTWSNVEITNVSVSYPAGVSVSVDNVNHRWYTDTEKGGSPLLYVHQNDAYC